MRRNFLDALFWEFLGTRRRTLTQGHVGWGDRTPDWMHAIAVLGWDRTIFWATKDFDRRSTKRGKKKRYHCRAATKAMWDDVTTYLIECTPFSLFSKPLLLSRALRTETLIAPHINNKRFANCECPDKLQQWENVTCMKTVLRSSTRHGVVDETIPHSSVRSFLVADYCDPTVTTFYGADVLFCKPCHGWKKFVHLHDVE